MKRLLGATLGVAIAAASLSSAQNVDGTRLPPGVSADNWIAMSSSAGFVVTSGDFQGSDRTTGSLKGYLVLRRGSTWYRVDTTGP